MRICTFNVRVLNGKPDLVQKLVDSTNLDIIGLTETWARPTDRFILPVKHEALSIEPTGHRRRGNAGIALAWKSIVEGETVLKHKSLNAQLLTTKFGDLSISVAYISPATSTEELRTTLNTARKQSQPKAIIMGDINARNTQWDSSTNTKGSEVLKSAEQHGWTINASASPSFTSVRGTRNVDLMICRNVQFDSLPSIPDGDWMDISDNKPVIAEVHGTAPDATPTTRVPWWKRNKPEIAEKAKDRAEELVPHLTELMEHAESTAQLEDLYKRSPHCTTVTCTENH